MRSVNTMLAWGHARVIENLMGQKHRMNPPPVRAISDQFAHSKETVAGALMSLGCGIELIQKHRAEEDLAVAAASILARNEFVTRLANLEKQFGMGFPKGASAMVDAAAKEFIAKHGAENSRKWPKCISAPLSERRACPSPRRSNGVAERGLQLGATRLNTRDCDPNLTNPVWQGTTCARSTGDENHETTNSVLLHPRGFPRPRGRPGRVCF